jgi:cell wall assembly regulator SMI1
VCSVDVRASEVSSAADRLRALDGLAWKDERGRTARFELLPPADARAIEWLTSRLGGSLPSDAREVLAVARGIESSPLAAIDFAGALDDQLESELFPGALPIAADGAGNFWVIESVAGADRWGPIYYVAHDPPVAVYQCADLGEFIDALGAHARHPHRGPLEEVHDDASARVWREQPGAIAQQDALRSSDPVLAEFARSLSDAWSIVDLRSPRRGDGVAWGRHGPRTELRRCGALPIFAYGPPPPTTQKTSWWRRVLG